LWRDAVLREVLQRDLKGDAALGLFAERQQGHVTRAQALRRFVALVRAAGLPPPDHNVLVEGIEVDLLWREERLVVEVDGFAYHSRQVAFERDRLRDSRLVALGFRVMRVTWRQIVHEHSAVIAALAQALVVRSQ
jgi:REase_MTES_1575